ncbi:MAG: hypothetical protein ACKOHI_06940, partial [Phycisphaerales bacterium]
MQHARADDARAPGVDVGGRKVRPIDLTARLLFPHWTYEEGESDITVMTVRAVELVVQRPGEADVAVAEAAPR